MGLIEFETIMREQLSRPVRGGYKERLRLYHRKADIILSLIPVEYHDRAIRMIAAWARI